MIDTIVKAALARNYDVFVKTDNPKKCGYIIDVHQVNGYKIRGSGRDKDFYVILDSSYKVVQDAGRLYVMPRSEWDASPEILA